MKKYPLILLLILISSYSILAQKKMTFSTLGISQGLSNSFVYDIVEDNNGFVWIATSNGLNRYDGYAIKKFQNDPTDSNSISFNKITSILPVNEGLWLGTRGGGLIFYNNETDIFSKIEAEDSLIQNRIQGIFDLEIDKQGDIWLATGRGIIKYHPKTNKFIEFNYIMNGEVSNTSLFNFQKILITKGQDVYAASNGAGLFELDKKANHFIRYTEEIYSIEHDYRLLFSIFEDDAGEIWFGSFIGGLHHFNKNTKAIEFFQNPYFNPGNYKSGVISINQLNAAELLIGLNGGGMAVFNKNTQTFVHNYTFSEVDKFSLTDNFVPCIYKDNRGIIWIGTENGGCSVFNPNEKKFNPIRPSENGISDKIINTFYQIDSVVWIGTEGGYINAFNINTQKVKAYPVPNYRASGQGVWIKAINALNKNELIVGSNMGGSSRFNTISHKFEFFNLNNHDILTITKDRNNIGWTGSFNGVFSFDNEKITGSYFHSGEIGIVNQPAQAIDFINNKVWVGYLGQGIHIIDRKSNQFELNFKNDPNNNSSLSSDFVYCIYHDTKNRIWVGTQNGLNLYDKKSKGFIKYFTKDGLSSNEVYGILEDKQGNLWMSTSYGLNKFNPEQNTFKVYYESDGLQSNQFRPNSYYKNKNGYLFFGGINGFNYFHPDSITTKSENGKLVLTDFQLFNKSVKVGHKTLSKSLQNTKELVLSHKDYIISFEFALLNYTLPDKNIYRYKLEGFTDDWIETGNRRFVSFTSLPDGDYTLHIQGANSDGFWSTNELVLKITITPPFYRTWWFYLSCIIFGLVITYMIFKLRLKNIQNQKNKLEELVDIRTIELKTQKEIVEHKNEEILSSLTYAKRIQNAILPPDKIVKKYLTESFILYKPKDIVAGDFYWLEQKDNKVLFAAADCTGHGVPGAMVSVVCHNALNRSVREYGLTDPGEILNKTREIVIAEFEKSDEAVKDGMDIAICSLSGNKLQYAGANNPLWIIRNREIIETKANKQPIGQFDNPSSYTTHTIKLQKGDSIYVFSDGYVDQFGGEKGKKFKAQAFRKLLLSIQEKTMEEQKIIINEAFETWKGSLEQIDDVCIIGVRI